MHLYYYYVWVSGCVLDGAGPVNSVLIYIPARSHSLPNKVFCVIVACEMKQIPGIRPGKSITRGSRMIHYKEEGECRGTNTLCLKEDYYTCIYTNNL